MANEDSALREVDRELDEERQQELIRKRGPQIIGAGLAIVLGVAGWQVWNAQKTSFAEGQALEFRDAVELLAEDRDGGRAALEAVAEEGGGYGVLARFHRAASFAQGGERLKAIEIFREIYNGGDASRRVKELARLRAAYLSLADGRDAVLDDLGNLTESDGAFGVYAQEVSGLAALEARDYETALTTFRSLSVNITAPEALRTRAEDFAALAASARSGVDITGDTQVEDLLDVLGGEVEAITSGEDLIEEDHTGHDHGDGDNQDAADTAEAGDASESAEEDSADDDGDVSTESENQ